MIWPQPHKVDARSLAAFRILLSAFILHDLYRRLEHGRLSLAWYYDQDDVADDDSSASPYFFPSVLDPNDTPHGSPVHKVWFFRGSPQLQIAMFALTSVIAFAFGIGYKTQWSSVLLWLFMNGIQNRSPHLADGSDLYLRNMLLWCTVCPVGRVWSIDSAMEAEGRLDKSGLQKAKEDTKYGDTCNEGKSSDADKVISTKSGTTLTRRHQSSAEASSDAVSTVEPQATEASYRLEKGVPHRPAASTTVQSVGALGCTLQVCLMYFGAVYRRFYGRMWLPPHLSAVYYVFNQAFASRQWAADFVRSYPQISRVMTAGGMIVEVCCPLACLLAPYDGKSWRHIPAAIMVLLHLTLYACMILFNWQFMSIICCVIWIPPNAWDSLTRTVNRVIQPRGPNSKSKQDEFTRNNCAQAQQSSQRGQISGRIRRFVSSFFLFYMIYNWCGERRWIAKHDGGDIGEFIRFNQNWLMYGEDVSTSSLVTLITGKLQQKQGDALSPEDDKDESTERRIDILKAVRTKDWGIGSELDYATYLAMRKEAPGNMASRFPSWRWEVAIKDWVSTRVKPHNMTPTRRVRRFGRVLCVAANEARTLQTRVTHVELAFWTLRTVRFEDTTPENRFHQPKTDDLVVEVACD